MYGYVSSQEGIYSCSINVFLASWVISVVPTTINLCLVVG